jgi:hypothetical protein
MNIKEQLWIQEKKVDLPAKPVRQTFQINNVAELRDRQLNFTSNIVLPLTENNIEVMEYLGVTGNQSTRPYRLLNARYSVGNIELISKGTAIVTKTDNGYSMHIYSGNAVLYETLKGRRLSTLNLEDLNHFLTEQSYSDSHTNTEGYIYAVGYFGYGNINIVQTEYQAPSVFKHTIFKKIMEQAGFTYEGDIFTDPEFLSEVITPTNGYDQNIVSETVTTIGNYDSNLIDISELTLPYPQIFNEQFTFAGLTNDQYTSTFDGILRLQFTSTHTLTKGAALIYIKKNGVNVVILNLAAGTGIDIDNTYNINIVTGDVITVHLQSTPYVSEITPEGKFQVEVSASCNIDLAEITGGLYIDFSLMFPETSQIDFIKDIMQTYGLIFQVDHTKKHYKFMTMESLLNDRDNAEDWSEKIKSNGSETYLIQNYAQNNLMKFNYNEDVQPAYDGILSVDNQTLQDEKTLFTSLYKISDRYSIKSGENVYLIPLWEEVDEDGSLVVKTKTTDLRSFKIKQITTVLTYSNIFTAGNSTINGTVSFLSLENMSYQQSIENYYPALRRALDRATKKTAKILLSPSDVYFLDFLKLKYIAQWGQYYYLNKITGYQAGKKATAEFIQARGTTTNKPPNQLGTRTLNVFHKSTTIMQLNYFTDTVPAYSDPEFDDPETIKITGGFNNDILMKYDGVVVVSEIDIPISMISLLTIEDQGNVDPAHTESFTFKIQSENNTDFSTVEGTIVINVSAKINLAPNANAGPNRTLAFQSSGSQSGVVLCDGSGSSDPNNDPLTYLWEFVNTPPPGITLSNANQETATVDGNTLTTDLHNETFEVRLTVTDDGLLTDTDMMQITLIDIDQI